MASRKLDSDSGMSPVMGIILIIAITLILSVVVYATVSAYEVREPVFASIEIESINLSNQQEVVLVHTGGHAFAVSDISIMISANGNSIPHNLDELPDSSVPGFAGFLGGVLWKPSGATAGYGHDNLWDSGDRGWFRIAPSTNIALQQGDLVTVTVIHRPTHTIISSPQRRI